MSSDALKDDMLTVYQRYYRKHKEERNYKHQLYQWQHAESINRNNQKCKAYKKIWAELRAIDHSLFYA